MCARRRSSRRRRGARPLSAPAASLLQVFDKKKHEQQDQDQWAPADDDDDDDWPIAAPTPSRWAAWSRSRGWPGVGCHDRLPLSGQQCLRLKKGLHFVKAALAASVAKVVGFAMLWFKHLKLVQVMGSQAAAAAAHGWSNSS